MLICRICLSTNIRMFNLQIDALRNCFLTVIGFSNEDANLPQHVCYLCTSQLMKSQKLIETSRFSKALLEDILSNYGDSISNGFKLTNKHMRHIDRKKLNLTSKLEAKALPMISISKETDSQLKLEKEHYLTGYFHDIVDIKKSDITFGNETKIEQVYTQDVLYKDLDIKEDISDTDNNDMFNNDFEAGLDIAVDDKWSVDAQEVDVNGDPDDLPLSFAIKNGYIAPTEPKKRKIKVQRKVRKKTVTNAEGLTQEEVKLEKYYDINILTLEEQIADRQKMKESATYRDALYRCDVCYRTYLHPSAYKSHLETHDPNQGTWECPVCKIRLKTESAGKKHVEKSHSKKYCCKSCPKTFTKIEQASKHSQRHAGYEYNCSLCEFAAATKPDLKQHLRAVHAVGACVCARCGLTFSNLRGLKLHTRRLHHARLSTDEEQSKTFECLKCDIQFSSEDAWREHISSHGPDENATCPVCGSQFANQRELNKHTRLAHDAGGGGGGDSWQFTGHCYPHKCEHCGVTVNNRKEHYFHVRKSHPKEREKYQPVITAVCDTCGKGFQNSTKLHLHELRHKGVGTVSCPHCPRLFYDKFHLARHIAVHSDARPHACSLCDKTFKLRSNLDRHAKVHSGVTAYECSMCNKRFRYSSSRNLHIKTVHYKLPQPPRKRRGKTAKSTVPAAYDDCAL